MKKELVRNLLILSVLFIILAILMFNQISFWFLGVAFVVIGFIILYLINRR